MFARTMPYQELEITHNVIACVITLNTTIRDLKSNSKMELKHKKKAKIFWAKMQKRYSKWILMS